VATVMSNLGLEKHLREQGLELIRTQVGDRYVVERMRAEGYNVGGEQSGHIVLSDYCTTGDGTIAALQILSLLQERGQKASEALQIFKPVPQKLQNIKLIKPINVSDPKLARAIEEARSRLGDRGQILVRPSGTEPLVRLMVQGDDEVLLTTILHELADVVEGMQQ
jgi:phosphoglucosamine mutase